MVSSKFCVLHSEFLLAYVLWGKLPLSMNDSPFRVFVLFYRLISIWLVGWDLIGQGTCVCGIKTGTLWIVCGGNNGK